MSNGEGGIEFFFQALDIDSQILFTAQLVAFFASFNRLMKGALDNHLKVISAL